MGSRAAGGRPGRSGSRYGSRVAAVLLVSAVTVNTVTIAADDQTGAAGIGLLAGISPRWIVAPLALVLTGMLLIGGYGQVVAVLRYLLLGFLALAVAAVLARPDWRRLLRASLVPALSPRSGDLAGALALLGTTLTSHVHVWERETIQRGVEEPAEHVPGRRGLAPARAAPSPARCSRQ